MEDFADANGPVKKRDEVRCVMCGKRVAINGLKQHIIAIHGGVYGRPNPPAAPADTEKER